MCCIVFCLKTTPCCGLLCHPPSLAFLSSPHHIQLKANDISKLSRTTMIATYHYKTCVVQVFIFFSFFFFLLLWWPLFVFLLLNTPFPLLTPDSFSFRTPEGNSRPLRNTTSQSGMQGSRGRKRCKIQRRPMGRRDAVARQQQLGIE